MHIEPPCPARQFFCGAPFDDSTREQLLNDIADRDATEPFAYVVTPNVDHIVRLAADQDVDLHDIYDDAWRSVCDSRVLAALSRLARRPLAVATGSDLTATLFRDVIRPSDEITIIGGSDLTVARIKLDFGLRHVQHLMPPMGLRNNRGAREACVDFVRCHPSRFVFLAVGSPQQEQIAHDLSRSDASGIGLCIGASLSFLAGEVARAPFWMQKAGLEWLHRLAGDPRRLWRRYLIDDIQILPLFLKECFARRGQLAGQGPSR